MDYEKADLYSEELERITAIRKWIGGIAAFNTTGIIAMGGVNYIVSPDERITYTYTPLALVAIINAGVILYLNHLSKLESMLMDAELNAYEEND